MISEGYGRFLGEFSSNDKILVMTRSGMYRLATFDLNNHFEEDILLLEKFKPQKIFSVIYWDAEQEFYYVKRFIIDPVSKLVDFLNENHETKLISVTEVEYPRFEIEFGGKNKNKDNEIIEVAEFIGVKSYKAKGKRLSNYFVENINEVEPVVKNETKINSGEQIDEEDKAEIADDNQNVDSGQMRLEM